ncbi:hypothetical protein A5847_002639, partial [Enterococcus faecium]
MLLYGRQAVDSKVALAEPYILLTIACIRYFITKTGEITKKLNIKRHSSLILYR